MMTWVWYYNIVNTKSHSDSCKYVLYGNEKEQLVIFFAGYKNYSFLSVTVCSAVSTIFGFIIGYASAVAAYSSVAAVGFIIAGSFEHLFSILAEDITWENRIHHTCQM